MMKARILPLACTAILIAVRVVLATAAVMGACHRVPECEVA